MPLAVPRGVARARDLAHRPAHRVGLEMPEAPASLVTIHLLRYDARTAVAAARFHQARAGALETTVPGLLHLQPFATSDMVTPSPRRLGLMCAWSDCSAADAFLASGHLAARSEEHTSELQSRQ